MEAVGNKIANQYFEFNQAANNSRPNINSADNLRRKFIQDKYVKRLWVNSQK
jgi:hypothetical protein